MDKIQGLWHGWILASMRALPPILPLALAVVWAVVLPACKTERTVIAERKNVDPIREKFAGNFDLVTDENGMTTVKSDKRSSFEAKTFRGGEAQARTKDFKTKDFNGLKEFKAGEAKLRKAFRTQSSRYQGQASTFDQHWKEADLEARETGKTFRTKDTRPRRRKRTAGRSPPGWRRTRRAIPGSTTLPSTTSAKPAPARAATPPSRISAT